MLGNVNKCQNLVSQMGLYRIRTTHDVWENACTVAHCMPPHPQWGPCGLVADLLPIIPSGLPIAKGDPLIL